jgi:hypothetical protein
MSEYISKDDAQVIINVLDKLTYTLQNAVVYISIKDRLQKYIDNPDSTQIKITGKNTAEVVEPAVIEPEIVK